MEKINICQQTDIQITHPYSSLFNIKIFMTKDGIQVVHEFYVTRQELLLLADYILDSKYEPVTAEQEKITDIL